MTIIYVGKQKRKENWIIIWMKTKRKKNNSSWWQHVAILASSWSHIILPPCPVSWRKRSRTLFHQYQNRNKETRKRNQSSRYCISIRATIHVIVYILSPWSIMWRRSRVSYHFVSSIATLKLRDNDVWCCVMVEHTHKRMHSYDVTLW